MTENPDSDNDSTESYSSHDNGKSSHLRWVFTGGGVAVAGLLLASVLWPNLTERTKFFTGNLLNLVIALAVIAQALIYRRQRDIMRDQWKAMHDQFMLTAVGLKHQISAHTVELKTMALQAGATVGQLKAIHEQVDLGKGQLEVMRGQLEAMKEQVALAGKQTDLTAKQVELMALSECAYVGIGEINPARIEDGFLIVTGKFVNGGRTPARDFRQKLGVGLATAPPPVGWVFDWEGKPCKESVASMLLAGRTINFDSQPYAMTENQIADFAAGKLMVLLLGECRFLDSMETTQVYTFCATLEGNRPRFNIHYQAHRREEANPS